MTTPNKGDNQPPPGGEVKAWTEAFPEIHADEGMRKFYGETFKSPVEALRGAVPALRWKETIAGNDPTRKTEVERFADLSKLGESFFAARERIRAGDLAKPLPANATVQEIAEFRAAQGIPENPSDYFKELPDGVVIGEGDKEIFDSFGKALQELNAPPAIAKGLTKWYYDLIDSEVQAEAELDTQQRQETDDALRTAWGKDYRTNLNVVNTFLAGLPAEVSAALKDARDANGRGLMNSPAVLAWLANQGRETFGGAIPIDVGGAQPLKNVQARLKEIDNLRRTDSKAYFKDEAIQAEERTLLEQVERFNNRGKPSQEQAA